VAKRASGSTEAAGTNTVTDVPREATRAGIGPAVVRCLAAALALSALYEALVALGVIELGRLPGDGPPGEGIVLAVGMLAMLAGVAVLPALVGTASPARDAAFLVAAALAFLVARYLSFDPYYLPTLRRMSDDGLVPPVWVVLLVAFGLGALLATRARPRLGLGISTGVLLLAAPTAFLMATGH
jgi:hypothetical protein